MSEDLGGVDTETSTLDELNNKRTMYKWHVKNRRMWQGKELVDERSNLVCIIFR